jgi:hypothetical protein
MGALIAWLGRGIVAALGGVLGGWRTWVGGVLIKVILVVVLYNVAAVFIGDILTWVLGKLAAVSGPTGGIATFDVATISSLAGWLVNKMMIPQCFAYMISCILLKWMLRKIPFVRW